MTEPAVIDRLELEGPWHGSIYRSRLKRDTYLCGTAGANLLGHSRFFAALDGGSRNVAGSRHSKQKAGGR